MEVQQTYAIFGWINESYLNKIIETLEKSSVIVKHFTINHATKKGENFAGALFRAIVKYSLRTNESNETIKEISLIIKAKLDDPLVNEIMEEFNIFQRESQVYGVINEQCLELLKNCGDNTAFAPELIYSDDRSIVLEDLCTKGYRLKDVKQRLNLSECKLVLNKVAKFHAVTAVLHENNPNLFIHHKQGNITEKFNPFHLVYQNAIESCIRCVKKVPELQQYIEKLEKFAIDIIPKLVRVYSSSSTDTFNALNHGDLWVNNIMFNDDKNDVILVDYQEGFYGSPGIDLNWFIYTSCNQNVISNHLNELLSYYHQILTNTLKSLNFIGNVPSLENIKQEIQSKGDHGLATLLCMTPILIMENKEYADAETMISGDEKCIEIRDIIFSNSNYIKLLIENLSDFVKNGHL